jgi:hypothetical protein
MWKASSSMIEIQGPTRSGSASMLGLTVERLSPVEGKVCLDLRYRFQFCLEDQVVGLGLDVVDGGHF